MPVDEQAPERERLGVAPVDAALGRAPTGRRSSWRCELRVDREAFGHGDQLAVERAEPFGGHGGHDLGRPGGRASPRGAGGSASSCFSRSCASRSSLERPVDHRLRLLGGDDALLDETRRVLLARGRLLGDHRGLQRLRVGRLVLLVVAEAAVADQIDDDVVAEPLPVRQSEPDGRDRRLGVVGVDVDDRRVEALGQVGRVARRPALAGIGREADLVVRDQVQRPARRVARRGPRS